MKKRTDTFLKNSGIPFVDLDKDTKNVFHNISPDIIFYQKPYEEVYKKNIRYWNHMRSLFCYVYYAFRSSDVSWSINLPLFDFLWQQYFENKLVTSPYRLSLMNDKGKQAVVTGLPIQDQLMIPKEKFADPWKNKTTQRKELSMLLIILLAPNICQV